MWTTYFYDFIALSDAFFLSWWGVLYTGYKYTSMISSGYPQSSTSSFLIVYNVSRLSANKTNTENIVSLYISESVNIEDSTWYYGQYDMYTTIRVWLLIKCISLFYLMTLEKGYEFGDKVRVKVYPLQAFKFQPRLFVTIDNE